MESNEPKIGFWKKTWKLLNKKHYVLNEAEEQEPLVNQKWYDIVIEFIFFDIFDIPYFNKAKTYLRFFAAIIFGCAAILLIMYVAAKIFIK